jgi:purine-binding chemotaxis protein CheW
MTKDTENKLQTYLSFKLGEGVFAINVSKVINILEVSQITKIPKAPEYMLGVINLRGMVLPVVDLRIKFGMPQAETTIDTNIIVLSISLNGEMVMVGTMVDTVKEVLELQTGDIAPSPSIGSKFNSDIIQGMWRHEDNFIMILDIDSVFSADDILDVKEFTNQDLSYTNNK